MLTLSPTCPRWRLWRLLTRARSRPGANFQWHPLIVGGLGIRASVKEAPRREAAKRHKRDKRLKRHRRFIL